MLQTAFAVGNHLLNLTEPEVAASPPDPSLWKSPAFIYGTVNGSIVFMEPMIQQANLAAVQDSGTVKCWMIYTMPSKFNIASNYPGAYCIDATQPGTLRVELRNFMQMPGGCNSSVVAKAGYASQSYLDALPPPPGTPALPAQCQAPMLHAAMGPGMAPGMAPSSPGSAPAPMASAGVVHHASWLVVGILCLLVSS